MVGKLSPNSHARCLRQKIAPAVIFQLLARNAGRCSICNKSLLENPRTLTPGNFGEVAHIIASSDFGPRSKPKVSKRERSAFQNLMLLCPTDHKEIDDHPQNYSISHLKGVKREHEERIDFVGELVSAPPTLLVRCLANIGSEQVAFSVEQLAQGFRSHYPMDRTGVELNLTNFSGDESVNALKAKATEVHARIREALKPRTDGRIVNHLSVFALGPIPLLISLGRSIGSGIDVSHYHRDRESGKWHWPKNMPPVDFEFVVSKKPSRPVGAAVMISVSGHVQLADLPKDVLKQRQIFEIRPKNRKPGLALLRNEETINNFTRCFGNLKTEIRKHWRTSPIFLMPAVPPSLAVALGRQILPKADPAIVIYDYRKNDGGFVPTIKIG